MARQDYLHHSRLRPGEGECVGVTARGLRSIMRSFYRSREHREVLRVDWFTRVGVGVYEKDGKTWVAIRLR